MGMRKRRKDGRAKGLRPVNNGRTGFADVLGRQSDYDHGHDLVGGRGSYSQ